mgnify:CR=1 FL=1
MINGVSDSAECCAITGFDDEEFGALLMLGELQERIYPLLDKMREMTK